MKASLTGYTVIASFMFGFNRTNGLCGYFLLWTARTIRKTVRTIIIIS